ncbi:MAG: DNA recombination protein RmuC [Phycisphaerales bacterium]|nr:DNA recombination protein RmuC [Phycisphaerales bacterium]
MEAVIAILATLLLATALVAAWLLRDRRAAHQRAQSAQHDADTLRAQLAAQDHAHTAYANQLEARLAERDKALRDAFSAAANDVLKSNEQQFLSIADQKLTHQLKPVADTLKELKDTSARIEKERHTSFGDLNAQLRAAHNATELLRKETGSLVNALRKPQVRGRYGEIQLRRVVELAGMRDYCDFDEQATTRDADGRALRPDCVVRLPNDRHIVIDAKNNTERYMEAFRAETPEQAEAHLKAFAKAVLEQARALAKKQYWREYKGSPDVVVMFIPGEQFIDAALQHEPELLEIAARHKVLIAGPASLIGLLRAVWVGWREKSISANIEHLLKLGQELHNRAAIMLQHMDKLGAAISTTAAQYNNLVGSVDRNLMPTLRKFEKSKVSSGKTLIEPKPRTVEPATSKHLPPPPTQPSLLDEP